MNQAAPNTRADDNQEGKRGLTARLGLVPIAAGLLFVILYGGFGIGRDTSPKIHNLREVESCKECHPEGDDTYKTLTRTEPDLCYRCHQGALEHGKSHPLGVAVKTLKDPTMPLSKGMIVCTTCHDPHGKVPDKLMLRRQGNALCTACHPEHGDATHGRIRPLKPKTKVK